MLYYILYREGNKMKKSALVLEGGAMRSLYTSEVLDVLMNNNININYCTDSKYIGAGAIKDSKGLVGFNYLQR